VVDVGGGMFGTAASEAAAGIRTFAPSPGLLPPVTVSGLAFKV